ncbi:MAG TPA: serine protease [Vicinamibacterales bacterium]|nr:serine protease [Vicinamibacterales bacterium]
MQLRRTLIHGAIGAGLAVSAFGLGNWSAQRAMARQNAENDARFTALREELARSIDEVRAPAFVSAMGASQSEMISEIKRQLQSEMGLMPLKLLRERRASFVELNTVDSLGKSGYGTAGYVGQGYFITVKHAVVALDDDDGARKITSVTLRYKGQDIAADVVDAGDATVEVHSGDWALLKVKDEIDLPALRVDTEFAYDFADPIFRLGNDYSKGISVSTGYVGQRTLNGLVTALTDGHPGVSGGGVLNQNGDLVGIPIGRMREDYRFSFILPVRAEMFRKIDSAGTIGPASPRTEAIVGKPVTEN